MVLKIETQEKYGASLVLNDAEMNDSFEFTLSFDAPLTGTREGKWGKYEWQKYGITLHSINGEDKQNLSCSFFARGGGPNPGMKFGEVLKQYSSGTRLRADAKLRKDIKGAFRLYWDVSVVGGSTTPNPSPHTPTTTSQLSETQQKIVNLLVEKSGGVKQSVEWVRHQLSGAGVNDVHLLSELTNAYRERF